MKFILTFIATFFLSTVFAQTNNCDEIKKENEYLKKSLEVVHGKSFETKIDGLLLKSIQCVVDPETKIAVVEILITNLGEDEREIILHGTSDIIDMEGNSYPVSIVSIGSVFKNFDDYLRYTLPPNVPIKMKLCTADIPKEVKMIKVAKVSMELKSNPGSYLDIYGKDIPVIIK